MLHSPAIVLVGHFAVRTDWSIPVKFAVILFGSLGLTLLVYELVVRNLAPLRFVFALKPRQAVESLPRFASSLRRLDET